MGYKTNKNQNGYTMFNENTSSSEIIQEGGNQRENNIEGETHFEDNYFDFPPLETVENNLRSRFQSVVERQLNSLRGPVEFTFAPRKTFSSSCSQTDFDFQETGKVSGKSLRTEKFRVKASELSPAIQQRNRVPRYFSDLNEMEENQIWNEDKTGYQREPSVQTLPQQQVLNQQYMIGSDKELSKEMNPTNQEEIIQSQKTMKQQFTIAQNEKPRYQALDEQGEIGSEPTSSNEISNSQTQHHIIIPKTKELSKDISKRLPAKEVLTRQYKNSTDAEPTQQMYSQRYTTDGEGEHPTVMSTHPMKRQQYMPDTQIARSKQLPAHKILNQQYTTGTDTEMSREVPKQSMAGQNGAIDSESEQSTNVPTQQRASGVHATENEEKRSKRLLAQKILNRPNITGTNTEPLFNIASQQLFGLPYTSELGIEQSAIVPKQQNASPEKTYNNGVNTSKMIPPEEIMSQQYKAGSNDEQSRNLPKQQIEGQKYTADFEVNKSDWLPTQMIFDRKHASDAEKQSRIIPTQQMADREFKTDTESESPGANKPRWLPTQKILHDGQYASDTEEKSRITPKQQMASRQYTSDNEPESRNNMEIASKSQILHEESSTDSDEGTGSRASHAQNNGRTGSALMDADQTLTALKEDTDDRRHTAHGYSKQRSDFSTASQKRNFKQSSNSKSDAVVFPKSLFNQNEESVSDDIPTDFLPAMEIKTIKKDFEVHSLDSLERDSGGEAEVFNNGKSTKGDSSLSSESSGQVVSDPSSELITEYSEYSTDIDVTLPIMSETPGSQHIRNFGDKISKSKYVPKINTFARQDSAWGRETHKDEYETKIEKSPISKNKVEATFEKSKKEEKDDKKKPKHKNGSDTEFPSEDNREISQHRNESGLGKKLAAVVSTDRGGKKRPERGNNSDITSSGEQVPESGRLRYKRKYETPVNDKSKEDLQNRKRKRKNEPLEESSTQNYMNNLDSGPNCQISSQDAKGKDGIFLSTGYKPRRDGCVAIVEGSSTSVYYSPSTAGSSGELASEGVDEDIKIKKTARNGKTNINGRSFVRRKYGGSESRRNESKQRTVSTKYRYNGKDERHISGQEAYGEFRKYTDKEYGIREQPVLFGKMRLAPKIDNLKILPQGNINKEKQNRGLVNFRERKTYPCDCQNCKNLNYGRKMGLSKNQAKGQEPFTVINLFVKCVRFCGESVIGLVCIMLISYLFSSSSTRPVSGTISKYLDFTHITQPPF